MMNGTRGFLHVGIPSPAPPPAYDDKLSTPELYTQKVSPMCSVQSVTHVPTRSQAASINALAGT